MEELLQQVPMFADLTPEERREVAEVCQPVTYAPGEHLCREGQAGDFMLIIESGKVWVYRETPAGEKADLATVTRGAILGEMSLVDSGVRSADAVASSQVQAHKIARTDFLLMRAEMSPVALKLMTKIATITCDRLRDLNWKMMKEIAHGEEAKKSASQRPAQSPAPRRARTTSQRKAHRGAPSASAARDADRLWSRLFGRSGS